MWIYEKKLEFPVKIKKTDPGLAKLILTQYGGPDGELGAAVRYLSQRFTMLTPEAKAILNDIGTEELAHLEMIGSIVMQLSEDADPCEIKKSGFDSYYVDHGTGIYPASAAGVPFSAATLQSTGNPVTDLYENMAAEQKARATYEYILNLTDDPDVRTPIKFLREREVVHFQRFGEALRLVEDYLNSDRCFVIPKPDFMKDKDDNCGCEKSENSRRSDRQESSFDEKHSSGGCDCSRNTNTRNSGRSSFRRGMMQ